ncbi:MULTISPECIES: sensor histidine kinase [Catenuloplanes]|uniref:Sensor-like histidine kinase SenX3 n=1 Tax=Catenuloplanes niger TaxID=587534 RepID=A0AAE3ZP16_9ACTN|nr:PAS domain-containing sensor histidine kinase [Catenuloplanes niger]MDR7323478.1 signal transduction histidine kinase [Catenuloplanes niger]
MPDRPDYAAFIAGHTAVINMINAGASGVTALNRLLEVVQTGLGAHGVSFAEYGPSRGRIVATSGASSWALGRVVDHADPSVARLLSGPATTEVPVTALPAEVAEQFTTRGIRRMLGARVEAGGLALGSLHAFFTDDEPSSPEAHGLLGYVAVSVAHLYGDQSGLPVHGDGPVVAALADGLAIVDSQGYVRLWNPAAERVTGRTAAQALNRPLPFPAPPTGRVIDHRLPDGRWMKIAAGDLPGRSYSRVVTFRDISDQNQLNHDWDLFLAVTSHELRTPVTVIKGYADTLTGHWDALADGDRREATRAIGQRATDLARLVDRLLATTGGLGPVGGSAPVPFDVVDALRAAVTELPTDLRRRLTLELPEDLPKAFGDRAAIATVVTELATNAGKYAEGDSPIELTAEADEQTVAFRVSDRGIGVRPEHVERAFDRFWQGESGDHRRYPGAGLGLFLVRRIVERQNGWASIRPRPGGGTIVEVRLPRG